MADQFRAASLGILGEDPVLTPHLDRLAETGCLVTQAVSSYPVCSPHRAMFLTGMRPDVNGVVLNVNSETAQDGVGLRDGLPTWASILRDHGWRTGYIGKWHLEPPVAEDERFGEGRREDGKVWDAWSPPTRRFGFDFWYSYGAADRHLAPHYWSTQADRDERIDVDEWSAEHETDVAIEFVENVGDEPFALMLSLNPPHQPFDQVPDRYRVYADLGERALLTRPNVQHGTEHAAEAAEIARDYFAAITGIDAQVDRVVTALSAMKTTRPTVILFTSDHGMQLGSHGLLYKNVPFEESMRLPLIVHAPGLVPPGRSEVVIDSLDFAPTILGLAGVSAADARVVGRDRSDALTGRATAASIDVFDDATIYLRHASRSDASSARGLRTPRGKLVATWRPSEGLDVQFFDLAADPYERRSTPDRGDAATYARRLDAALASADDGWEGRAALAARYAVGVAD